MRWWSRSLLVSWCGLAWLAGVSCGSQWTPQAQLSEIACGAGRCFGVDVPDRVEGFAALVDSCGRELLTRQATLVGAGDRLVLAGRLRAPLSPLEGCEETGSEQFVAGMDLSTDDGGTTVRRDAMAEQLGVVGNAALVTGEGRYVVFAGDFNRTERFLWQEDDLWQNAVVEGADATDDAPAPTAQAIPLSDGSALVVRPPGPQGRRLRLESLSVPTLRATTLWPPSEESLHVKLEADLAGEAAHLRAFEGGAAERILLFGGSGAPVWFSLTKAGFIAEGSASVSGAGAAWLASAIVPLPQFQATHGYAAGTLLVVGGTANNFPAQAVSEAPLQLFEPAGNRWLAAPKPLPWSLLHTTPVLLPDGSIALIGGRRDPQGMLDLDDTRVIYLYPDVAPVAGAEAEGAARPAEFSVTVGRAPLSRARGEGTAALLLPSGAVFVGGGKVADGDLATENADFEVLAPPYLADGRPRPLIRAAPPSLTVGRPFALEIEPTSARPTTVVLMGFGSVTCGRNVSQRHVELAVQSVSPDGRELVVRGPDTALLAPPGRYLLFAIDDARTPSRGVPVALGLEEGTAP
jgi:hypothetical protein